ncbi:hypothetical protein OJF2_22280 [Aquisphaera giovannonii]|uniref:DUF7670 domain-containing protein n=1 Tax=Aquisphaera giovannonii TaxID=406548 RepID=A0A5B9VZE5_9BACT|nr:hypothetical protein [Aquisphaera giovannonii]QEH33722.1 hypothetical protein OJF2_22280 [Aquisphaera giovannonii]
MNPAWGAILHWTPRVLGCGFVLFVAMFALDVFDETHGLLETLLELIIHLIPAAFALVAVAISWRWPGAGALLFGGLGASYIAMVWGRGHWTWYVAIAGPCFLLGLLFLADALARARLRAG